MRQASLTWLFVVCSLSLATAQIRPDHAVVLIRLAGPQVAALIEVDMAQQLAVPIGRFPSDASVPLAVTIDPVNRDLIVAVRMAGGSRLLRLRLRGRQVSSERALADLPGSLTDLRIGLDGGLLATTGGAAGALWSVPRNGGTPRRIGSFPRATALFPRSVFGDSGVVAQSGTAPGVDPRVDIVDFATGRVQPRLDMSGWRPFGLTGVTDAPSALAMVLLTHDDGTVAVAMGFGVAPKLLPLPQLPAGATEALALTDARVPVVLGNRAHPFLKSFDPFRPENGWTTRSPSLPGDPVDFAIADAARPRFIVFGERCTRNGIEAAIGAHGEPRIGNREFLVSGRGAANSVMTVALGASERRFFGMPLPFPLPGGCRLQVAAHATGPVPTDGRGVAFLPFPIPNDPRLIGGIVYVQWAQVAGGALLTTDAGAVHIR